MRWVPLAAFIFFLQSPYDKMDGMSNVQQRREGYILRLIVGISGASGVIMGWYLLKALHELPEVETHLIITEGAAVTFPYETNGMIIIPCSMKTVAGIVSGYTDDLLLRAADVCLKEGRKVVIVPREMPMSRIHLRNIKEAADYGCIVVPPVLTFYNGADTVEKQIQHIVGKILMQFHISYRDFVPWQGGKPMV